jgi:hypothetical protein
VKETETIYGDYGCPAASPGDLPGVDPGVRRPAIKPWNCMQEIVTGEIGSSPYASLQRTKLFKTSFDAVLAEISVATGLGVAVGTKGRDSYVNSSCVND